MSERTLSIRIKWWQDDRLHEMELIRFTLNELDLMMKYGGAEWQDHIETMPLDVTRIDSMTVLICKMD